MDQLHGLIRLLIYTLARKPQLEAVLHAKDQDGLEYGR
jgi:hypothetical protein